MINDNFGVHVGARGNVSEGPRGFELEVEVVVEGQKQNQAGHNSAVDHFLDRRVALCVERKSS